MLRVNRFAAAIDMIAAGTSAPMPMAAKAMPANQLGNISWNSTGTIVLPSSPIGVTPAAIAIGALVPAAIMSIAAANLFTRNIYKEYLKPDATPAQEAQASKLISLVVKVGALVVIWLFDVQFALDFQLIGGIIIIQTLPAIVGGLFTRWFHRWALLGGWAVGMAMSLWMLWITPNVATGKEHLGGPLFPLAKWFGADTKATIWTGLVTLAVNILVSIILTIVLRAIKADPGVDTTDDTDYHVEAGDPGVEAEPVAAGQATTKEP